MFTAKAVVVPPRPPGPIPVLFIFSNSSFSNCAICGMFEFSSTGLVSAFFANIAHFSKYHLTKDRASAKIYLPNRI